MRRFRLFLISFAGFFLGVCIGYVFNYRLGNINFNPGYTSEVTGGATPSFGNSKREVFGFLPYWLLDKAREDYSGYVTTLNFFGLTIDNDGRIKKKTSPVEFEPGYYALTGGVAGKFLEAAKAHNIKLSLTAFSGDQEVIMALIDEPISHARNLVDDFAPFMNQFGFSDLNLDIEGVNTASPEAQMKYIKFVAEVRNQMKARNLGTLSIDLIPVDFVRDDHLAVPSALVGYVDKMILMAYDFHSFGSSVTGPVAPLYGTETVAEFDTNVALSAALRSYPAQKILLGIPSYGYTWETIGDFPRAATIPSSGLVKSVREVDGLLPSCQNCVRGFDKEAQEAYIIYKNETGTYQQVFYPDARSFNAKLNYIIGNNLGGAAIWALGYESNEDLNIIQTFLSNR